jgi:hypothetical protein
MRREFENNVYENMDVSIQEALQFFSKSPDLKLSQILKGLKMSQLKFMHIVLFLLGKGFIVEHFDYYILKLPSRHNLKVLQA